MTWSPKLTLHGLWRAVPAMSSEDYVAIQVKLLTAKHHPHAQAMHKLRERERERERKRERQRNRERKTDKERRRERKTERYRETTLRTFPHDDVHAHLACREVHLLARQQQKMAWLRRGESSTCPFWLASPTAASESGLMRAWSPTPPDVCTSMCIGELH